MTAILPYLYWTVIAISTTSIFWYKKRAHLGFGSGACWALLTLAHGLILKPIFIFFEYPNREILEVMLLRDTTYVDYWGWSLGLLLPYLLFLVSMFLVGRYRQNFSIKISSHSGSIFFDEFVLLIFYFIAFGAIIGFFFQFPQLLVGGNKNSISTLDIAEYSGGGIWRTLAEFGYLVSICALMNVGLGRRPELNLKIFKISLALWLVFCFYSDQRGAMMFAVITYLIAWTRYVKPIPRKIVMVVGSIIAALILMKTAMRLQVGIDNANVEIEIANITANFIGQNLIENGKTISIIKAVPQNIDYQLGKTYLDALLILVPRSLFPDKTTVNLDTLVGTQVFDCSAIGACGVPPGLVAESFINFGYSGIIILSLLSGLVVGLIDRRFRIARLGTRGEIYFIYLLIYFGMSVLGSGLSSFITQAAVRLIEVSVLVMLSARGVRLRMQDSKNMSKYNNQR